jgi:hypothetical protein
MSKENWLLCALLNVVLFDVLSIRDGYSCIPNTRFNGYLLYFLYSSNNSMSAQDVCICTENHFTAFLYFHIKPDDGHLGPKHVANC